MMHDLSSKINRMNGLQNGKGIQHLLNCGYQILGNPLYIHDIDYKLLARTEDIVTDDPLWNELLTKGLHGKESVEFFKNEDFIEAVANAKTITFLISDKLKYDRIFGKIRNKRNITVAGMDIVACHKPFESDDAQAFELLCELVSKEISRNDFYDIYGEQHQEQIICDLLDGAIHDKRLYARRVESIYEGLSNNIYIAAVDISKINVGHAYCTYFKDLFKNTERTFKYAVYNDYITFLFSSDDCSPNIHATMHKLMRVFERNNMHIGISSGFENLFIAQKYFAQAVDALHAGRKQNANQRIHQYSGYV